MNTTTNNTICFHTNTEIDPLAWKVMGLHAKETEDSIGRFGTGLKYAIAILIRTGHKVSVFVAGTEYKFHTQSLQFRSKDFEALACNGEVLPFTTEYGKDWKLWMAYRELVSNTMDEGGLHFMGTALDHGTSIVVEGEGIIECLNNHEDYFVGDREPVWEGSKVSVYKGEGTVYYKGVRVGTMIDGSRYSYDIKTKLDLTEDRSCNQYTARWKVSDAITECTDKDFLREFLSGPHVKGDEDLGYSGLWSDEFTEVAAKIYSTNPRLLPFGVRSKLKEKKPDAAFKEQAFTKLQAGAVEKCKRFLAQIGYHITCPVQLVENEDDNLIAIYTQGKIFLTERAFGKGLHYLCSTLLEEHFHSLGYHDESRSFEQFLMDEIIRHGCDKTETML